MELDDPAFENATLTIDLTSDKTDERKIHHNAKFTECNWFLTHLYGAPLRYGRNELLATEIIWSFKLETGNYTAHIEANMPMPDGRRLFCFESGLYIDIHPPRSIQQTWR